MDNRLPEQHGFQKQHAQNGEPGQGDPILDADRSARQRGRAGLAEPEESEHVDDAAHRPIGCARPHPEAKFPQHPQRRQHARRQQCQLDGPPAINAPRRICSINPVLAWPPHISGFSSQLDPSSCASPPDTACAAAAKVISIHARRSGAPAGKLRNTSTQSHNSTAAMAVTDSAEVPPEVP